MKQWMNVVVAAAAIGVSANAFAYFNHGPAIEAPAATNGPGFYSVNYKPDGHGGTAGSQFAPISHASSHISDITIVNGAPSRLKGALVCSPRFISGLGKSSLVVVKNARLSCYATVINCAQPAFQSNADCEAAANYLG